MNSPFIQKLTICFLMMILFLLFPQKAFTIAAVQPNVSPERISEIEQWVQEQMKKAEIPGMSVTIVNGKETLYQQGFGYSDLSEKTTVSDSTVFEIGSNSKAFTALAVLKLEKEGKLKLSDPLEDYIPWLKATFNGKPAVITIEQLLHHTSGIPFETIGKLPEGYGEDALENTVRILEDYQLNREPGESFEYATINYDVLGLVIERVTGQSYADYMGEQIFKPLGLTDTFVLKEPGVPEEAATGYKFGYTDPRPYEPPFYVGNAPAGYVMSNAQDMALWLKIQLGTVRNGSFDFSLIEASHLANRTVKPDFNGSSYAAGWDVFQKGEGEISHAGNNPTFSSFVSMRPGEKIGVVVLANINTDYTQVIGQGILHQLIGEEPPLLTSDTYKKVDSIAVGLIVALLPISIIILIYVLTTIRAITRGERHGVFNKIRSYFSLLLHLLVLGAAAMAIYKVPDILFYKLTWRFIQVWMPETVFTAVWLIIIAGGLYAIYSLLLTFFPKKKEKSFLKPIVLGVVSGVGNAFVIFIINESIVRTNNLTNGLLFYFVIAILMYVVGQRYVRAMLVNLTNEIIYEKRIELIDKLLNTRFSILEGMERGRVEATLNNDTEVISRSIGIVISGATNLITLVFCFLYLGVMNVYALFLSIVIIVFLAILYLVVGNRANKIMEETRDLQNVFFGFISDMLNGFKELTLNIKKRRDFRKGIQESCNSYKEKRNIYQLRYSDIFVLGELLFVLVIGCVVFVFPEIFKQMDQIMLSNYVFVFLYMTGPVNQLLDSVPHFAQIRVSWDRIKQMNKELNSLEEYPTDGHNFNGSESVQLRLNDVTYSYNGANDITHSSFEVGPINYEFRSGTIVFITGGNGSGKSTFAKLLTGLYEPDAGHITLNGESVSPVELGQYYSAIFGDYHLFDRFYGVDWQAKEVEMNYYLERLELQDKLKIQNGVFSTTKLSTGQKKRLALLITYLEDKPICLFDEWAADQDPEYRRFFYEVLLPEMKASGKCIIAITHDDHYFHLADDMIKMDMGQMQVLEQAAQRSL
ncbi:cyclic peptide export ABC transporter [Metabacillus halosaccharovorans]|nr:cyclic peptide export ABC transporter [Metabacillus halosaccharovorans]MCM3439298.1 cyclic peptide export ABC transporter [Metabacillus halosaccharovorans]